MLYRKARTLVLASFVISILIGIRLINMFNSRNVAELDEKSNSISKILKSHPDIPYEYQDDQEPDIRIIVLTHKRHESLRKLLNSLNGLEMDGDTAALEIWIDRNKTEHVSSEVISVIDEFRFKHGRTRVHVQEKHVGIMGQWIDTWRPKLPAERKSSETSLPEELVVYLEDDMSLSPYAYRWLRAAQRYYANRTDLAGLTLQSDDFIVPRTGSKWTPKSKNLTFLYVVSSWGFAPRPSVWRDFQDWFKAKVKDPGFRPYVSGIISTNWYKTFEKRGTADTMWTMWFIYYCHHNKLYTLYSNIRGYDNNRTDSCLAVNRLEPGLHYHGKGIDNTALLLRSWKNEYVAFNNTIPIYKFNGKE